MRIDDIIRVEDEERIVIGEGTEGANLTEQLVERVALADLIGVETLKRDGARLTRDAGGGVRAVVGQDVDIQQLGRVILRAEAGNEFADDAFLVAGADQRGIAAARFGGRLPRGFSSVAAAERKAVKRVENLIQIGYKEQHADDSIDLIQKAKHKRIPFVKVCLCFYKVHALDINVKSRREM